MRKTSIKNKKPVKSSGKISSYFTKIVNGSANKNAAAPKSEPRTPQSLKKTDLNRTSSIELNQNTSSEVVNVDDSDEDFVQSTPTSKHLKSICCASSSDTTFALHSTNHKLAENVLESIINLPKCSKTPDFVQLTPDCKKRKHSRENSLSPDVIPCSLKVKRTNFIKFHSLNFPPKKKAARESNNVVVSNLSELPKAEFDKLQSPSKNNDDLRLYVSDSPGRLRCKPVEELLEDRLCLPQLSETSETNCSKKSLCLKQSVGNDWGLPVVPTDAERTPEKLVKVNTSKQQTMNSLEKFNVNKKSPGLARRITPMKLFNKSPKKLHTFNVEVVENFVKITPSKSSEKNKVIYPDASPSVSARSIEKQLQNESTPTKSPPKQRTTSQHSKVKTKLNFSPNNMEMQVEKANNFNETENFTCNNSLQEEKKDRSNANENDISAMLNDSWDGGFEDGAEHTLDLTESQHCKIIDLEQSWSCITLTLRSTKDDALGKCIVEGFWVDMKLAVNDTVHVTAVYDPVKSAWCVSNECGLIVFEPDHLISSTSLVGALFCRRRSVLSEKYHGFEPSNRLMVIGILVHKLLQEVLRNNIVLFSEVEVRVKKLIIQKDTVWMCYESAIEVDDVEKELMEFVPKIVTFMKQYVRQHGNGNFVGKVNKEDWKGKIDHIQDIEENIWCPELGVKGKVDVSIQSGSTTMPLELKTGRASVSLEHRGQVILYVMMMNKFGYTVPSGLLLYLREGVLREIPTTHKEKRDIMILRNELTYYLTRKPKVVDVSGSGDGGTWGSLTHFELPKPINHHNACSKCPYSVICCTYLKFEGADLTNNPLKTLQKDVLSHLEPAHLKYFVDWSSLLALEATCNVGSKQLHEIYMVPPEKREKNGYCIAKVKIKEAVSEIGGLFKHVFEKNCVSDCAVNLHSYGIVVGNYVVVSISTRPAVAAGFVTDMDFQTITISLDRDLNKRYSNEAFHLDTYVSSTSQTFNMTNLALLLEASEQAEKLRKIIIDKMPSTFQSKLPKAVATKGTPILRTLNKMQQKAILKALSTNEYLLIKGMPGTGKTATIVSLVQLFVELNKTVLITSHTHAAVDNVCIRLQACGVNVLRLGAESRINPKLHLCSESSLTKHCVTPKQLEEVYNGANVLAVTCLGSGHPVLGKRQLDVCIVDESTQVVQCSVFRALYCARKFILIGDPEQLAPVVKNREAVTKGLTESLFERLDSLGATVSLSLNYRMNKPITAMANALTYEGQLLTGNNTVANATLELPLKEKFLQVYERYPWITKVLDQSLELSVKIVDTGPVWNRLSHLPKEYFDATISSDEAMKCSNPYETAVVLTLVDALLEAGVPKTTIGVIAPYRAQASQISLALKKRDIEISTVDQFQGRDKDVILYSCTKSSGTIKTDVKFDILEDKRRLTVAITRARHKFVLIGDLATVGQYSPFAKLLACLEESCFVKLQDNQLGFRWDDIMT